MTDWPAHNTGQLLFLDLAHAISFPRVVITVPGYECAANKPAKEAAADPEW